jgi:hypothetical protein
VLTERAKGQPFDSGRYEVHEEALDAPKSPLPAPRALVRPVG